MHKEGKKRRSVIRYLLYLVLASCTLTSVTLAKYASTEQGLATAVVASFATGGTMDFDVALDGELYPGSEEKAIRFTVTNYEGDKNCQVGLDYSIRVETTGNLPLEFTLRSQKESDDSSAASVLAGPLTRKESGEWQALGGKLPPVDGQDQRKVHTYELVVTWPASTAGEDYSREIDLLKITVQADQAGNA